MASRFYTNPFIKDAQTVAVRDFTEWRYSGTSHRGDGTFHVWSREVKYSDGTVRVEEHERPMEPLVHAGRIDLKQYEDDGNGGCLHCRRPLSQHSGPSLPPDLCPYQAR